MHRITHTKVVANAVVSSSTGGGTGGTAGACTVAEHDRDGDQVPGCWDGRAAVSPDGRAHSIYGGGLHGCADSR